MEGNDPEPAFSSELKIAHTLLFSSRRGWGSLEPASIQVMEMNGAHWQWPVVKPLLGYLQCRA